MTGPCDDCDAMASIGVALRIGWMVTPRFALLYDGSGFIEFPDGSLSGNTSSLMLGGAGQFWVVPRLWLKAGAGLARLEVGEFIGQQGHEDSALGLTFAAGYELSQFGRFQLEAEFRGVVGLWLGVGLGQVAVVHELRQILIVLGSVVVDEGNPATGRWSAPPNPGLAVVVGALGTPYIARGGSLFITEMALARLSPARRLAVLATAPGAHLGFVELLVEVGDFVHRLLNLLVCFSVWQLAGGDELIDHLAKAGQGVAAPATDQGSVEPDFLLPGLFLDDFADCTHLAQCSP
jgi:hypothetical protein